METDFTKETGFMDEINKDREWVNAIVHLITNTIEEGGDLPDGLHLVLLDVENTLQDIRGNANELFELTKAYHSGNGGEASAGS